MAISWHFIDFGDEDPPQGAFSSFAADAPKTPFLAGTYGPYLLFFDFGDEARPGGIFAICWGDSKSTVFRV